MPFAARCPHCQKQYQLPEQLAGKTVKCKQCQKDFAVPGVAPSTAGVSGGGAQPQGRVPAASSSGNSELARYGVDGPLVRTSTDIFADAPTPPRSGDPLGNYASEDPGFAGSALHGKPSKKASQPLTPPKQKTKSDTSPALPFDNPHAASAAAFSKQPKKNTAELQKEFERLDQVGNQHKSMTIGLLAAIAIPPVIIGILFLLLAINGFTINWSKPKLGLTDGLYYAALGLPGLAALIFLVTYFVFANGTVRLAAALKPGTKSWLGHLFSCLTIVGGLVSFIILNFAARKQLKQAGFQVGLLGVTKAPEA